MRRVLLVSLSLASFVWITGCGSLYGSGSGGGGNTPDALSGQYAILLAGFDSTGNPMGIAGSIKADGLGHITGGEVDVNDNGVISSNSALAGSYAFDANGQSTLGTITLTNTVGTVAHPLAFGFSLKTSGAFGQIMSLDSNNFIAAGTMQLQSSSVFTLANLAGDYIVTLNGRNGTTPTSALGRLTLGTGGASTNVTFDRSAAGMGTAGPTTGAAATVSFAAAGPDANGRGTFMLSLNDGLIPTATQNFAYYAITANRIIGVETDANKTMTADFSRQQDTTPFTASTVVTAGSVFGMAGIDLVADNEISAVGQLQLTGAGAGMGALTWDSNDAGIIPGNTNSIGLTVTFDPNTGRGTVAVPGGTAKGLAESVAFYLTASGTGFIMDTTTGTTNRAMAGTLTAQATGPFSAATDLGGLAIVRSRGSSANDEFAFVGLFGATLTPGTYAFLFDQQFLLNGLQTQRDTVASGVTVGTIDANGRGTLGLPNGANTATEVFYIVGPNQFVLIDISPAGSPLNGPSSVFFVDPQ